MSYKHFSIEEREILAVRLAEGENPTQIAKELQRHHSSVLAEIRRNSIDGEYYPAHAQALADQRRRSSKNPWRMQCLKVCGCVKDGLKHKWSPEQIANRMKEDHPEDQTMRVSHQTIYDWIRNDEQHGKRYRAFLRQSDRKRRKRYGTSEKRGRIKGRIDIDERPEVVDEKSGSVIGKAIPSKEPKALVT